MAAARGLLVVSGEGGRSLRMTEKLITSYERFFACVMILTDVSAQRVQAKMYERKI